MKFEFNCQSGFGENFEYMDPIWVTFNLAERLKVNLDLWNLFIDIVSLRLTYQVRIMTLVPTVLKNQLFKKKNPFKCIRKQNRPWSLVGQGQSRIIIWINLLGPTSPMLHTKSQSHLPFGSGEDFLRVYTIYGNGGHLGHVTRTIWTNLVSLSLRSLHMKFDFDWPGGFWKNYVLIYCWDSNISNLGWKVKGKPWPLELSYSHCLIMLNI